MVRPPFLFLLFLSLHNLELGVVELLICTVPLSVVRGGLCLVIWYSQHSSSITLPSKQVPWSEWAGQLFIKINFFQSPLAADSAVWSWVGNATARMIKERAYTCNTSATFLQLGSQSWPKAEDNLSVCYWLAPVVLQALPLYNFGNVHILAGLPLINVDDSNSSGASCRFWVA